MSSTTAATDATTVSARLISALPDAISACAFLFCWIAPLAWRPGLSKDLMLVMLLEFLVVHSSGFLGTIVFSDNPRRGRKSLALVGFSLFYLLFVGGFSFAFESWWPLLAFAWLLAGKFFMVWFRPVPRAEERARQAAFWAASVAAYLFAVFAGVLLPLPQLGLTPEVVASLGLPGSGLWIEQPQTVMASGTIYFGLLACGKWMYRPDWTKLLRMS